MSIPGSFSLSDSVSKFDVFKNMSVGLNRQDLALETVTSGSKLELKCVQHNFEAGGTGSVMAQNSNAVREELMKSVNEVLEKVENGFYVDVCFDTETDENGLDSEAKLANKISELKSIVNEKLAISTADTNAKVLMTSEVEKVVVDVEKLVRKLSDMSADAFLKMDTDGLQKLVAETTGNAQETADTARIQKEAVKAREIKGKINALSKPLNEEQKLFLKQEIEELKAFHNKLAEKGITPDGFPVKDKNGNVKYDKRYFQAAILDYKFKKAMDAKYQEEVFKLFGDICSPVSYNEIKDDIEAGVFKNPCVKKNCEKLTVEKGTCSTSKGLDQLVGERNISVIAGDNTQYEGLRLANTQEEAAFFDMSPISTAIMLKLGYIEPVEAGTKSAPAEYANKCPPIPVMRFRYKLDEFGLSKMNTMSGYLLRMFKVSTDGMPNDDIKETTFAMCAAPGFGLDAKGRSNSLDENNFAWMIHNRKDGWRDKLEPFTKKPEHDRPMLDNAKEFYKLIHEAEEDLMKKPIMKGGLKFSAEQQKSFKPSAMDDLSMIASYGNYVDPCSNPEDAAKKLIKLIKKGKYQNELKVAIANYKKNLQLQTDGWAKMMTALGAENIQHTGIGTSAFRNCEPWMINSLAKSVVKFLGNQKNYLNLYDPSKPGLYDLMHKGIEMHQKNTVNLLREEGMDDAMIKMKLRAKELSTNEIDELFKYAEEHKGIVVELEVA